MNRRDDVAARDHYESCWFGWCELCSKWRLRVFWWVGADGLCGDTVCGRCRPGVKDYCCQRVPAGGPFCTNPPTHDVDTNYGYLGSVCDEHWAALGELLGGDDVER